ncbi:MAG: pseudaminic acid cytidylyltransferase [Cyanobacteria bacterium SBC]|nr:pseudaminic acid cytidylyltransferase [Cyanobacteria bacterium SBC]
MKIAVIPARGGSKRIPRKNIRNFAGKPAIARTIQTARECGLFDAIIVSTDDSEIAEVSRQWGAEVPFIRPAELANDFAGTTEVIAHATQWAIDEGWNLDAVCCIYATALFLQSGDLQRGWESLNSGDWLYAFSATDFAYPIFRAFKQTANKGVEMFFPEYFTTRSQDLPVALHDAGQFYWGRPQAWLEQKRIFDRWSIPVTIPRWRVQDIDTEEDWLQAELMWEAILARKNNFLGNS